MLIILRKSKTLKGSLFPVGRWSWAVDWRQSVWQAWRVASV